ncbi:hypothetical protein MBOURGENBZM_17960 [Methanoculleus bourgensis]|nr:hypothetical protein MBOURGENBZM_17960 [Methanoculleus bourgensis]
MLDDCRAPVGRAIVDNDDLKFLFGLGEYRPNRPFDVWGLVVERNDYRNGWFTIACQKPAPPSSRRG